MGIYDECHDAGGMFAYEWDRDPKRAGFIMARYKFVAKMLHGKNMVLEIGCADGVGSRIVRQAVHGLDAIDVDAKSIEEAVLNSSPKWPVTFEARDCFDPPLERDSYDAVYALDVFEHIQPLSSDVFLKMLHDCAPLAIIGTPSLESQAYASRLSKEGHINCHSGDDLRAACLQHWRHVLMFGMNDETLHTGFLPMSQYLFAVCVR